MRNRKRNKPKFTTIERVPCWAMCYLGNGDSSGLSDDDLQLCLAYERKLEKDGLRLVTPIDGTRNEFDPLPAFGKACDTESWTAEILPPDRIVFRKYWDRFARMWTPIAFMPDFPANPGFVVSFEHHGQHCEASLGYYRSTKPCEEGEYSALLDEMVRDYRYRPKVMKRLIMARDR